MMKVLFTVLMLNFFVMNACFELKYSDQCEFETVNDTDCKLSFAVLRQGSSNNDCEKLI